MGKTLQFRFPNQLPKNKRTLVNYYKKCELEFIKQKKAK